jgi:uncharacterized protein (DUF1697 family)
MTVYIALLRAVNVGGTGRLPMAELKNLCEELGFTGVRTYIASGNVVFAATKPAAKVKTGLESRLATYAGKPVGVMVRTLEEVKDVLAACPFAGAEPNRTVAIFLDAPPPHDAEARVTGRADEQLALGAREIYVFYAGGMASTKLKIPAARHGTARNMNTIAKLVELASAL